MEPEAEEILRRAVNLPKEARAALADSLLESLDDEVDEGAEDAWRDEIRKRLEEIEGKRVQLIPWEEARNRLKSRITGDT